MDAFSLPRFVTVTQLAAELKLPPSTVARRIEKLRVPPDAFIERGHQDDAPLFNAQRLPQLQTALLTEWA